MNKLKKIGLTALAASLVTTSAFAAELTATGSASMGVKNNTGTSDPSNGKSFTMGNSVTFAGSGETDGGLTVSLSFELDINLSCQYLLIEALALPVFEDDNQCKEGETFVEVKILTISPFLRIVCQSLSMPLITQPVAVSPILVCTV